MPYSGRVSAALQIAGAIVLTLCIDMTFDLPAMGPSLYMVFFVARGTPAKTIKSFLAMCIVTGLMLLIAFVVAAMPGEQAAIRFVSCSAIIFAGMYFSQALTQLGRLALMVAVFGSIFVQQWDHGYPAEATLEAMLYSWLSLLSGLASGTMFELVFSSRSAFSNLRQDLSSRINIVESALREALTSKNSRKALQQLQREQAKGSAGMEALMATAEGEDSALSNIHIAVVAAIRLSTVLVEQTAEFLSARKEEPDGGERDAHRALMEECGNLQAAIWQENRYVVSPPNSHAWEDTSFESLGMTVTRIGLMLEGASKLRVWTGSKHKARALKPDAWSNKQYAINAAKVTAAAMLCWIIYKAVAWPQIETSVITCLITAQGTLGAERERQTLRLSGDTAAGLAAIAALIWAIPNIENLAGLAVLFAVVGFAGAWVYLGSPRISYAGRQFSYCFGLATLTSSHTPSSLNEARDRVVGVMLGVTMTWLIYDQIQPLRSFDQLKTLLTGALRPLVKIAQMRQSRTDDHLDQGALATLRDAFTKSIEALHRSFDVQPYEAENRMTGRREMIARLKHISHLLQQVFVTEIVLLDQPKPQVATSLRSPYVAAEELSSLISRLQMTRSKELSHKTDQDPSSEYALLQELRLAVQAAFPLQVVRRSP